MKSLKNLREAIIRAHNRGKGQREIADLLCISPGTVNKAIKWFEETGSYEDRPGRGPKKTARSQENVQRARKLAKKLGVGKDSARRILRMDLKRKPYKMLKRQKLTAADFISRDDILEEKACPKPHPNVESLKRALLKAWDEIDVETLAKIVDNFPKRLEKCVAANGGHFE
uniref:Transposase n=1 Tax=Acrobeloides nanus TaxID=290746 RepID=A0A914CXL7_9BILA